jgi:MOSC domain-containing protein YiiM
MAQLIGRDDDGTIVRKAGVMGVVLAAGDVRPGDAIHIELPPGPHVPLERV